MKIDKVNDEFIVDCTNNEEIIPHKWAVRITEENREILKEWVLSRSDFDKDYLTHDSCFKIGYFVLEKILDRSYQWWNNELLKEHKEITFEQFKKHILKQEDMEKKIIGYKLIKPKYKEAVQSIAGSYGIKDILDIDNFPNVIEELKKAGVLDLWFEPIYEAQKTVIKMHSSNKGEFEIEIIDGKAWYRPENKHLPKEWIEEIIDIFGDIIININTHNPYTVAIGTLNVGCMEGTRKEDWEKVYKLLE